MQDPPAFTAVRKVTPPASAHGRGVDGQNEMNIIGSRSSEFLSPKPGAGISRARMKSAPNVSSIVQQAPLSIQLQRRRKHPSHGSQRQSTVSQQQHGHHKCAAHNCPYAVSTHIKHMADRRHRASDPEGTIKQRRAMSLSHLSEVSDDTDAAMEPITNIPRMNSATSTPKTLSWCPGNKENALDNTLLSVDNAPTEKMAVFRISDASNISEASAAVKPHASFDDAIGNLGSTYLSRAQNQQYIDKPQIFTKRMSSSSLDAVVQQDNGQFLGIPAPEIIGHCSQASSVFDRSSYRAVKTKVNCTAARSDLFKFLSTIYAIFLVVAGMCVCLGSILVDKYRYAYRALSNSYFYYLYGVSLIFMGYLISSVRKHLRREKKTTDNDSSAADEEEGRGEVFTLEGVDGNGWSDTDVGLGTSSQDQLQMPRSHPKFGDTPLTTPYEFDLGRHGASFYLQLGATVFCICTMINLFLQFTKMMAAEPDCRCNWDIIGTTMQIIFSFVQLYVIFKKSNIVINRNNMLVRFGLMHVMATNLCVWFKTLLVETIEELYHKFADNQDIPLNDHVSIFFHMTQTIIYQFWLELGERLSFKTEAHINTTNMEYVTKTAQSQYTRVTSMASDSNDSCYRSENYKLLDLTTTAVPYLYPFIVEYSLIACGVMYLIWARVGEVDAEDTGDDSFFAASLTRTSNNRSRATHHVMHVDCSGSMKGLFIGIILVVLMTVRIVLFFVYYDIDGDMAVMNNLVTHLIMYIMMLSSLAIGFHRMKQLDYDAGLDEDSHSGANFSMDYFLLIIALPCFFFYCIMSIASVFFLDGDDHIGNEVTGDRIDTYTGYIVYITPITNLMELIQVVAQNAFILDGLKRYCTRTRLQREKPGRACLTLLIICNVLLWIVDTLEVRKVQAISVQQHVFGAFNWIILSDITIPLTIFYRFHSSVCLADIWSAAYLPLHH